MHRSLLFLGALLALSACGRKDAVEVELDRFRAMGSPVTPEDLQLPRGGYESPEWKTVLAVSKKLKAEYEASVFRSSADTAMKPVGPGVATSLTRQPSLPGSHNKKAVTWSELQPFLARSETLLETLPQTPSGPIFIPDYHQGFNTQMPQIGVLLDIAKTSHVVILGKIQGGKLDPALTELERALQWNRTLTGNRSLIDGMVRVGCDHFLIGASWEMLQHPRINDAQLARLAGLWNDPFGIPDVLAVWQGERVMAWQTLSHFRSIKGLRELSKNNKADPSAIRMPGGWLGSRLYVQFLFETDLAFFLSFFHEQEIQIQNWATTRQYAPLRQESQKLEAFLMQMPKWKRYRYILSSLALPAVGTAHDSFASHMAQQQLLLTAIALKRHELAQRRLPDSLDLLVPRYLPSIPLDPLDGQPLRYRKEPGGGYTLYSVGVNGIDDGGNFEETQPSPSGKKNWNPRKTHDIPWFREAP